ncbi:MAG: hypothetical protein JSW43_05705 [Gemmatimonadota bacterium]|nr:MAG: hypothetical protein JSW43_05705 [Gemmatimonadota bacterium]
MSWAEVVTAISTAVIAVVALAVGVAALAAIRHMSGLRKVLERVAQSLEQDARPVLQSVRSMVDDATGVVAAVRSEADGFIGASHDLRDRLERLVGRTEERLQDLDALVDVLQYEIEETALDVAAALRTTRRGTRVFRAMKRAFLRRGR